MCRLLDLLTENGQKDTFMTFVKILQFDYDWIAEKLSECNNRDSQDAASHLNNDTLAAVDNLQCVLLQSEIPFPPPHLIPCHAKVSFSSEILLITNTCNIFIIYRFLKSENVFKV